jgi:hypothetical protein
LGVPVYTRTDPIVVVERSYSEERVEDTTVGLFVWEGLVGLEVAVVVAKKWESCCGRKRGGGGREGIDNDEAEDG